MIEMAFAAFALALGFKHSYDADHLLAVSSALRKSDTIKDSLKISFSWAAGHMITAAIVTVVLFYFREAFLITMMPLFEKITGFMLIILGIFSLKDVLNIHSHFHRHGKLKHSHIHMHSGEGHDHKHMFGIGIVQGLASNDEILILLTASLGVTTIGALILGIGLFSIGVVLGMMLFSAIFAFSIVAANSSKVFQGISLLVGLASIAYGIMILA